MGKIFKVLTLASVIALAGCSAPLQKIGEKLGISTESAVSKKLTPPSGNAFMTLNAKGYQIFRCTVDTKGPYYRFERPEASLYDSSGQEVAKLLGPMSAITANDGSSIISTKVKTWANSSDPQKDLILALLVAYPNDTPGMLNGVKYIQRLNTKGGLPQSSCQPQNAGKLLKVPFRAEFVFWK